MPRINTNDLLERIGKGDFLAVRLNGLQGGSFCMLLVVTFDSSAMIGGNPLGSFVPEICRIQDDYQSGTELPHSKAVAILLSFRRQLYNDCQCDCSPGFEKRG